MNLRDWFILATALALLGFAGSWRQWTSQPTPPVSPTPNPTPTPNLTPRPDCPDGTCPTPRPRPWGDVSASVGGPRHVDGTELLLDLPLTLHQRNTGGSDGSGLCVFASMRHSGLWANEPVFTSLFEWMKKRPGGGYPEKVDRMISQFCKESRAAPPDYIQVESAELDILCQACAAGLMPAVTYWHSPTGRYGGRRIPHMVSLVHADHQHFAILDNNYVGSYEWMTPNEFRSTFTDRNSKKGWAIIPLKPGPPPIPH